MRYYFLFFLLSIFLFSCKKDIENKIDISHIEVDFSLSRFELDFYDSDLNLASLKIKYPFLFPLNTPDSIWQQKRINKDELELFSEVQKQFQELSKTQKELSSLFKHIKFYNKNFKEPDVVTVLSNIDYEYRVVYNGKMLIVSLDVYLGKMHPFYNDFPDYIKENNTQDRIVVDAANQFINAQVKPSRNRSFLAKMILAGKKKYLLDLYVPEVKDEIKIGYASEKYLWAIDNEEAVWKYFIEENLLYSTDTKLNKRFLDEAPFSKFYLTQDSKSPGRIGEWIGWQIVRSFMRKNDVSLQSLLTMDEEEIFKKSNYKPRK